MSAILCSFSAVCVCAQDIRHNKRLDFVIVHGSLVTSEAPMLVIGRWMQMQLLQGAFLRIKMVHKVDYNVGSLGQKQRRKRQGASLM